MIILLNYENKNEKNKFHKFFYPIPLIYDKYINWYINERQIS